MKPVRYTTEMEIDLPDAKCEHCGSTDYEFKDVGREEKRHRKETTGSRMVPVCSDCGRRIPLD